MEWLKVIAAQTIGAGKALHVKQDGAFKSGVQGRIPDVLWKIKQHPVLPAGDTP
jgi:hypothetical protein